jgi:short-subunit dehydrogenase
MKTVLITGGSSGIGLTTGIILTNMGYNVICTTRDPKKIQKSVLKQIAIEDNTRFSIKKQKLIGGEIKYSLERKGTFLPKAIHDSLDSLIEKIRFEELDITKDESVKHCVDRIEKDYPIDILINNAGFSYFGSVETLPIEKLIKQFDTNLFGHIRMIQAVLPRMRERKSGHIINISSLASLFSIPFQAHYSATKAAIKSLTESFAMELSPFGIKISSLSPGDINTSFNRNMMATGTKIQDDSKITSTMIEEILKNNPEPEGSPYIENSNEVWKRVVLNLVVSPGPYIIAKKIFEILTDKKNRVHYYAASTSQLFFKWLVSGKLSEYFKIKQTANFFGVNFV